MIWAISVTRKREEHHERKDQKPRTPIIGNEDGIPESGRRLRRGALTAAFRSFF